jgi:prepilin-type N-terminal cleavage/methylation domain-containing protein
MKAKRRKANFSESKRTPIPADAEPGGFTLVELLVAMVIASILLAAVVGLFTTLNKSYTEQNVAAEVQQVTRAGVDFMAQSIRMAGLDPAQTDEFGFTVATANSIEFTADFNMSGTLETTSERIGYFLNVDELQSSLDAVPLVENVTGLAFVYLAGDDSILPNPVPEHDLDAIRTVRISLTVREPAGRGETVVRTYNTEVRCRNLGI